MTSPTGVGRGGKRIAGRLRFSFLSALLPLVATAPAAAAIYYVSAAGLDTNAGTLASPFRQIRRAITVSHAGDTVLVADGSYLGFDLDSMAGTALAPFTIRALGYGATVVPTTDRSDNRDTIHVLLSSYVVLDGLRSFNANRAAVRIDQTDHVTVKNGTFGNNSTWGIFTDFADDLLLENNECYGSGTQHGIYVSNSSQRPIVRGNRLHDNAGCGLQLNADLSMGPPGLITGAVVENNVIWNNGTAGGAAINLDGVQDSIVRNNLLYGNHASGIACFQIDGAAGPAGMQIVNNTVDMASDARWALLFKSSAGVNLVRNNVLYDRNPSRGGIVYGDATDVADTDSDYNILDAVSPDDGATRITLSTWKFEGHEPHSFSALPTTLFLSFGGGDYHLASGSPAIDAGQTQSSVPTDIEGHARPIEAAYDIGCFEFAAPSGSFLYTLPLCRLLDTRSASGPLGGPALAGGTTRTFAVGSVCGIPPTAVSVSVNVTVTGSSGPGDLRLFAGEALAPRTSAINYRAGQTRANNATVGLGPAEMLAVQCDQAAGTVDLVIDVNGYFQ